MRLLLTIVAAVLVSGCATWDGINFGLDVANADTTISLRQGGGKTVVAAEQGGQKVSGFFAR